MSISWWGTHLQISRSALSFVRSSARLSRDGSEVGGILLGRPETPPRLFGDALMITEAGGPGPAAIRSPSTFTRDLLHSQQMALDAFARDRSEWLGEWHTHPLGPARPSGLDLRSYRAHLSDEALDFQLFVSIIVTPGLHMRRGRHERDWDSPRFNAFVVRPWTIERVTLRAAGRATTSTRLTCTSTSQDALVPHETDD